MRRSYQCRIYALNGAASPTGESHTLELWEGQVDQRTVQDIPEGIDMANLLQQYIEQGLEQGRMEGKRDTIRTVLRSRFGSLPETIERHIAGADVAELDVLAIRAGTVENLDDLQ